MSTKTTLFCIDCEHRFTIPGSFSWEGIECPNCDTTGDVVGRIVDGTEIYFADDESELEMTAELPKIEDDQFNV